MSISAAPAIPISMLQSTIAPCTSRGIVLLGETAVMCDESGALSSFTVTTNGSISTKAGSFRHDKMLGKPYGSLIEPIGAAAEDGRPSYVLKLTPELWTLSLPRRTQILFSADIALIVARLNSRPGACLVESGTGSGSLTHALARAVAPGGSVYTYEFNAQRAAQALNEFTLHGLGGVVRSSCRDVVQDGFVGGIGGAPLRGATGLFLDVPNPWAAVHHASAALSLGGILCSFSPCVEQVARVSIAAAAQGFGDICVYETLARPWVMAKAPRFLPDLNLGTFSEGQPSLLVELKDEKTKDEEDFSATSTSGIIPISHAPKWSASSGGNKRMREENAKSLPKPPPPVSSNNIDLKSSTIIASTAAPSTRQPISRPRPYPPLPPVDLITAQPLAHARGHTGYLLFCTKFH